MLYVEDVPAAYFIATHRLAVCEMKNINMVMLFAKKINFVNFNAIIVFIRICEI